MGTDPFYDPANEAQVLRLLEGSDVPAPDLYAADLEPASCDVPAVLESWMPGQTAAPRDVDGYRSAGGDPDDRHPFWDLLDAADCLLDSSHGNALKEHDPARFEAWVAEALAEL
jgi:hypothetical protein